MDTQAAVEHRAYNLEAQNAQIDFCGQFHKAEKFVITKIIFVITKKNYKCL